LQGFSYAGQLQVRRGATTCRSLLARFLARGGPHFAPRGWLVNSRRPIEVQVCQMKIMLAGYRKRITYPLTGGNSAIFPSKVTFTGGSQVLEEVGPAFHILVPPRSERS
jgi:hypothetical protein